MSKAVEGLQRYILAAGGLLPKWGVDGDFGKETLHAIDNLRVPNWVKVALKEVGVHEIHGVEHSDRVLEYHSVSGGFTTDEVPWCASYINWVMLECGFDTVSYPARAKSWLRFGATSIIPVLGSIAVKSREGGGHVCIVVGQNNEGQLYCVGGNQSDEVNIRLYDKEVFIDFRVPETYKRDDLPVYSLDLSRSIRES